MKITVKKWVFDELKKIASANNLTIEEVAAYALQTFVTEYEYYMQMHEELQIPPIQAPQQTEP